MMDTQVIRIDPHRIDRVALDIAVDVLKRDGVMVYPTETFYGLGVNAFSAAAIDKVYALKGREKSKPLSVVISEPEMLRELIAEVPPLFKPLAEAFWPGPLTLVFKASPHIPSELVAKGGTIGVRLPAVPWIWTLIDRTGFPLTATSANLSGEEAEADPESVLQIFRGKVELILDAGSTPGALPSSVVDLTGDSPRILREGQIPGSQLRSFWA